MTINQQPILMNENLYLKINVQELNDFHEDPLPDGNIRINYEDQDIFKMKESSKHILACGGIDVNHPMGGLWNLHIKEICFFWP